MPVRTAPTFTHPTLKSTITGVLGGNDVVSYLGVPYGSLSMRWTYATWRDDVGIHFDAMGPWVHGSMGESCLK